MLPRAQFMRHTAIVDFFACFQTSSYVSSLPPRSAHPASPFLLTAPSATRLIAPLHIASHIKLSFPR